MLCGTLPWNAVLPRGSYSGHEGSRNLTKHGVWNRAPCAPPGNSCTSNLCLGRASALLRIKVPALAKAFALSCRWRSHHH